MSHAINLGIKWVSAYLVLVLFTPLQVFTAIVPAVFVAALAYPGDLWLAGRGLKPWATVLLDGLTAAVALWLAGLILPAVRLPWGSLVLAAIAIGLVEIPLHRVIARYLGRRVV